MSFFDRLISAAYAADPAVPVAGSTAAIPEAPPTTVTAAASPVTATIDPAAATTIAEPSIFVRFLPIILIVFVFYFLLVRPQQKRMAAQDAFVKGLQVGDNVTTNGGLLGTIVKFEGEDVAVIEIASNVRVRVLRATVSAAPSPTPTTAKSVQGAVEILPPANDKSPKSKKK